MNEKIKILMTLGTTSREGAQTYSMSVLRNIDRERFQIDFAVNYKSSNGYESEMEQLGSTIHIIPKFKGVNYWKYIRALKDLFAQEKYDIIHGHVSSSAALYLKEARRYGCATIAHSHSAGYRGNYIERAIKKLFTLGAKRQADYWFACSDLAAKRMFGKNYKCNPNYYDIPNAIDTGRYLFKQSVREKIRESLPVENDAILYGHVGSFSAPKNHQFLIDVFEQICNCQNNKAYLILLGEGLLRDEIERKVTERGLQDKVIFAGNVGNVHEYLMAMDTLIFPSLFEGFPVALLEAQAAGLYSVVSDSITKEVNLTECVVSVALEDGAAQWAKIAQQIPTIDRVEMNRIVAGTRYNMRNSVVTLTGLYEQMCQEKSR